MIRLCRVRSFSVGTPTAESPGVTVSAFPVCGVDWPDWLRLACAVSIAILTIVMNDN